LDINILPFKLLVNMHVGKRSQSSGTVLRICSLFTLL